MGALLIIKKSTKFLSNLALESLVSTLNVYEYLNFVRHLATKSEVQLLW